MAPEPGPFTIGPGLANLTVPSATPLTPKLALESNSVPEMKDWTPPLTVLLVITPLPAVPVMKAEPP